MSAKLKPSEQLQPIIIKKIKKVSGHGHHGGAWKVAYADFVTAMMAFFLLMWLLNATSDEQKMGISNYFDPIGVSQGATGAGGVMGGKSIKSEGVLHDVTATPTVGPPLGSDAEGDGETPAATGIKSPDQLTPDEKKKLEKSVDDYEDQLFKAAEADLKKAVSGDPELNAFMDNLKFDRTPEGLRIQIVDAGNRSMFPSGSSRMYSYMEKLLQKVALVVIRMPNKISIGGHTDAHQYALRNSYTNWELSSDRANASRRVLIASGLSPDRIASVVGKAETDPLVKGNPEDPANRRISITLLKKSISDPGSGQKKEATPSSAEKAPAAQAPSAGTAPPSATQTPAPAAASAIK